VGGGVTQLIDADDHTSARRRPLLPGAGVRIVELLVARERSPGGDRVRMADRRAHRRRRGRPRRSALRIAVGQFGFKDYAGVADTGVVRWPFVILFGLAAFGAFAVDPLVLGIPLGWMFFHVAVRQERGAPLLKLVVLTVSAVLFVYSVLLHQ
jgi:hypothetical protein